MFWVLSLFASLCISLSSSFPSYSSSSLFRPIQLASPSLTVQISYFVPEGLTYDENNDRVILASLSTGEIRSFPNTNQLTETEIGVGSLSSTLLYSGRFKGIDTPIAGIKVYDNILYGAVGSIPPLTGPFYGGLLILDLNNVSDVQLIDFSSLAAGKLMTPNDVVYSEYANAIFITDFYSYRIFKYDLTTQTLSIILQNGLLCSICSGDLVYDGPNGIATKDNYLIVARSGTLSYGSTPALIKVPIDVPSSAVEIPVSPSNTASESILDGADGLLFDPDENILYLTSNGKGLIVAIRSTYPSSTPWSSGQVVSTFATNCKYNDPSTSTIIPGTGDLLVICTEQFGAGPYHLNRLSGIATNYAASHSFRYDLDLTNMLPESLVYQPSTDSILYSSYGLGKIYSTSNPSIPPTSDYSTSSQTIHQIVQPFPLKYLQPLGIQVDPLYDNMVWTAYNSINGAEAGIYRCNSLNGQCDIILNQADGTNPPFYNDVSIDPVDGCVYSTDMGLSHRIESHLPGKYRAETSSNWVVTTKLIAEDICVDCSSTCDGTGDCGPNGIALIPNENERAEALITGAFSMTPSKNGIFRVNIAKGSKTRLTAVPDTFVDHLDGMRFDPEGEFLFVASFGTDAITAYYSCDDWKSTIYVGGVFSGGCSDGTNTAITYTTSGDLIITCVNNFGPGPYTSTRITNIRSRLLGVSYSSIEDYCEGEEPFQVDSTSDNDDDSFRPSFLMFSPILVFTAFFLFSASYYYYIKSTYLRLGATTSKEAVGNERL